MSQRGPTPRRAHLTLQVIADAAGRSVLSRDTVEVLIRGTDAPRLVMDCGGCAARLTDGVSTSRLADLVLRCPGCGALNATVEG